MSDSISRQDAIDAVMETESVYESVSYEAYQKTKDVIKAIESLPTITAADGKENLNRAFRKGFECGEASAMRDASCRAYNEITKYLERQNLPRAKEKADYICQIVKGFMADEVMGAGEGER